MYFLLILFFGSLIGITFMVGRKFIILKNGQLLHANDEVILKAPYLEEWKHLTIKNVKKYGYVLLVAFIRLYFKSSLYFKNKYEEIKGKIKNRNKKNQIEGGKKEISNFFKIISKYKHKIRRIKQQVKEEENF